MTDRSGDKPKGYADYRELLDNEKPDIAIIATPDHWHALQTIDALKAGAHVFVEKPTGHTVNESRGMLRTARGSGRLLSPNFRDFPQKLSYALVNLEGKKRVSAGRFAGAAGELNPFTHRTCS